MMDVSPKSRARIEAKHGKTGYNSPIKMVEVTKIRDADMEDLFDPMFYLKARQHGLRRRVASRAHHESDKRPESAYRPAHP